jgi:hypothetical protein
MQGNSPGNLRNTHRVGLTEANWFVPPTVEALIIPAKPTRSRSFCGGNITDCVKVDWDAEGPRAVLDWIKWRSAIADVWKN